MESGGRKTISFREGEITFITGPFDEGWRGYFVSEETKKQLSGERIFMRYKAAGGETLSR